MMKTFLWCLFVAIFLPYLQAGNQKNKVTVINSWKNLEFGFDSQEQKDYALAMGYYSPSGQKRPYDADVYILPNGTWRKFLSMPRVSEKIPFTLATVDEQSSTSNGPLLRAYPDMSWHLNRTCDKIFAVFRLWIDNKCDRLWVIDSGRDFTAGAKTQICPPKIVTFDLRTHKMTFKYELPADQYISEISIFNSITLSPSLDCRNQYAYITDARGPGLVVYDLNQRISWKTQSPLYKADPNYYKTTIANETFNFTDGLYTVAPYFKKNLLCFHPFATINESIVPLSIINNRTLWTSSIPVVNTDKYFTSIGQRPTQSLTEAFDSRGNLWFTLLDPLSIVCWNSANPYSKKYFKTVTKDEVNLQFVAGLKIRKDPIFGEVLIGISNRNQKHNTGTVSPEEINYRLFYLPIKNIDCRHV